MIKTSQATVLIMALTLILIAGCRRQRTHPTPAEALTEFPGYLNERNRDSYQLLAQREHPMGLVLLYAFGGTGPDEEGQMCVGTTFVSEQDGGRWRTQSSGRLGCHADFLQPETITLGLTAGGNITGLTTVYGLAPEGATVRVRWSDGQVSSADIDEGYVLLSRPETVQPEQVEILDADGEVIHRE